ncbi:(2Fe-2S) ferredoxin domain-containing protein [Streptomyces sp. NPDC102279]|uniref:(2Fe-2S) ferredoxin domain-containing protein n=1 Tax=Streptomyces sp. NPDC102279 TaxID=3366153 RepID=UPI00380B2872
MPSCRRWRRRIRRSPSPAPSTWCCRSRRRRCAPTSPTGAAMSGPARSSSAHRPAPLAGVTLVRRTDCLDACERANVIVIQPSAEGRAASGRPVRLGQVNDPGAAADITAWIKNGSPGLAEAPDILDLYTVSPSRRARHELED